MTDQELRSAWLDTQTRLEQIEKELQLINSSRFNYNRKTSLDNLIRKYKTFACISCAMILCISGWYNSHIITPPYNLIIPSIMAGYFLIAACMDIYLMRGLKSINLNTMSVSTVCGLVNKYRHLHHLFMIILIPICILIVGLMISAFVNNTSMIAGIIAGVIAGLAIGTMQYIRIMKDYKILSEA